MNDHIGHKNEYILPESESPVGNAVLPSGSLISPALECLMKVSILTD